MKNGKKKAPAPVLRRLSTYHHVISGLKQREIHRISSSLLADLLEIKPIQVRKDLQATGLVGRPRTGFEVSEVERAIREFLGWSLESKAVLFGMGNLGNALLNYPWREDHGVRFIGAFETQADRSNILVNNVPVFHVSYFPEFARENKIDIGVIAVPADDAQGVADLIVTAGVMGIWNFSHTHLRTRPGISVENARFTQSLAILTRRLVESRATDPGGVDP